MTIIQKAQEKLSCYNYLIIPFAVALLFRLLYVSMRIPDFWGDSYHNWYISWSILENDWIYSDYKGRELVWLPFYRYVVAVLMSVFKTDGLMLGHLFNIVTGSITAGYAAYSKKLWIWPQMKMDGVGNDITDSRL